MARRRKPTDEDGKKTHTEFDCPLCDANNPYDDGFRDGDEVRCNYCGADFKVRAHEGSTRFRLREI